MCGESGEDKNQSTKHFGWDLFEAMLETGAAFIIGALLVASYKAIQWLRLGYWQEFSVFDLMEMIPIFRHWIWVHQPDNWIGFHSILIDILNYQIPTFLFSVGACFLIIAALAPTR